MGAEELRAAFGDAARIVWPRSRRWRRFLRTLSLDPDGLPRPVPPPGDRDFIICGSPRSGTTLVAGMLHQPPGAVVAMEPWDGMRLPPAELFASLRREIAQTGRLRRQRLDARALESEGEARWIHEGDAAEPVVVDDDYLLGVKWPAFWRYLDLLPETRFVVCLRDPVQTVASYRGAGGRLVRGLNYDVAFNRRMNDELRRATRRFVERRALLYEYINSRIVPHVGRPNVLAVRYERWSEDPAAVTEELGRFLGVSLDPSRVRIHRPPAARLDPHEAALVARTCRSAEALGYRLPTPTGAAR